MLFGTRNLTWFVIYTEVTAFWVYLITVTQWNCAAPYLCVYSHCSNDCVCKLYTAVNRSCTVLLGEVGWSGWPSKYFCDNTGQKCINTNVTLAEPWEGWGGADISRCDISKQIFVSYSTGFFKISWQVTPSPNKVLSNIKLSQYDHFWTKYFLKLHGGGGDLVCDADGCLAKQ